MFRCPLSSLNPGARHPEDQGHRLRRAPTLDGGNTRGPPRQRVHRFQDEFVRRHAEAKLLVVFVNDVDHELRYPAEIIGRGAVTAQDLPATFES